jgi:hypothetical protein
MSAANMSDQRLYLTGYIQALKDLRELLGESDKPPIIALCGALDNKLAQLRKEQSTLARRGGKVA